jgi:hypothetical protein
MGHPPLHSRRAQDQRANQVKDSSASGQLPANASLIRI